MSSSRCFLGALAALALALCGCSTERSPNDLISPNDVGVIVVDAALIVGESLPEVILRRTQSAEIPYDDRNARVHFANVSISAAATETDSAFTIDYDEISSGKYSAPGRPLVSENRDYHLRVVTREGEIVTADTHTPAAFHVDSWLRLDDNTLGVRDTLVTFDEVSPPDSVYLKNDFIYQDGLLEARFQRVECAGYQVGIKSLDEGSPLVIDADFLSQEDIDNLPRNPVSPPFEAADGFVRLPWFAIFFEGRYRIRIFAVDKNWYDLIRSSPAMGGDNSGFGGNAGDRFEKPIFHINGGIGLFGSASMDQIGFYVEPRPEDVPRP